MKPERDRVKALLTEAVTLLCKNSVTFQAEVEVEGLLGITVDRNEVFLVSLHEVISKRPEVQQMLQHQSYPQQFTSTPSYSPTLSKRKRRRKSGEGTPQHTPKKMTPTPSSDPSEAIVLEDDDDEESNGTIDFQEGAQSAQNTGDTNLDTSQGQGEPTSDTTFDDFQDTSNPAAFSDQSALGATNTGGDNSQDNLETGDADQLSQEQFGDDGPTPGASVKREKLDSFSPQQDDSLGGGFDSFETEQKWSATMGMMQQGDGSQGLIGGTGFAMPQGASAQQSPNTQKRGRYSISPGYPVGLNMKGKYACWSGECRKEYNSALQLLMHQYEHGHLDYLCCVCNRAFSRKDILRRHVKSLHLQEHFTCSQCVETRTFNRKDHYRAHQLKVHGLVLCEECGVGFTETKSLKQHLIMEHSTKSDPK